MVNSKKDLKECLRIEIFSTYGRWTIKDRLFPPPSFQFIKCLRNFEYHYNSKGLLHRFLLLISYFRYYRISRSSGITIPKNTCGKGLTLYHSGSIVVNQAAIIGKNCCIMNNVNIGANQGSDKAPRIGDNVYIGPGAVIFGDISIADGCYIGANAVVNKSVLNPNSVVVGIPAKIIKEDPIHWWEKNNLKR